MKLKQIFSLIALTAGSFASYQSGAQCTIPLTGAYTINSGAATGGTNYQTFAAAVTALTGCGISGPVTFNVVAGSGPYTEQVIIPQIATASSTRTITFNGNGETLAFASTVTGQRGVVKLDGADYVTFNNLTIDGTGGTYAIGFHLLNDADNNTISNCAININQSTTTTNFAGIALSGGATSATTTGSNCDNNTITGNNIDGGYYSITMLGSTTTRINNNKVTNNIIRNFYYYGISADYHNNLLIEGNDIHRLTRGAVSIFYGMDLNNVIKTTINRNKLHDPATGHSTNASTMYGIAISASDPVAGDENIISNNLIYNFTRGGAQYGIYNSGSDNARYFHNTISLEDGAYTGTGATRGFYQLTAATGIRFSSNVVKVDRGGAGDQYAMYFGTTTTTFTGNRNVYSVGPTGTGINGIGFYNANPQLTLAAWQAATANDANSLTDNPVFVNPATGDFTPTNPNIDNEGAPVGITTDLNGAARSATTPDPGAYEFTPPACVAPPTAGTVTASTLAVCTGASVVLNLQGNSIGSGQTYQWQSSSTVSGIYTNIGAPQTKSKLTLSPTTIQYYRAQVTCGASTVTTAPLRVFISTIMPGGTYTIDATSPTGGTNFENFTDAVNALKCGISGPVTFNVASGVYTEQIEIPQVSGASAANRVTFFGATASVMDAKLTFTSTGAANNYVVKLNNASFITFDGINIVNDGAAFSRVIEFNGTAAKDSIRNCVLEAPAITGSSVNNAVIIAEDVTGSDNVIYANTMKNGAIGMRLYGVSTTDLTKNWVIENNNIIDASYYSMYMYYTANTKFRNNYISTSSASTTHYAVYSYYGDSSLEVTGNKVIATTPGTRYGINIYYSDATASARGLIANNSVVLGDGASTVYGLRVQYTSYQRVYNNSVSINSGATGAAGYIYESSATYNDNEVRNNVFYNEGAGHAMYVYNPIIGSNNTIDYNNLYTLGANLVDQGTPVADYADLTAWRATGMDKNSISYYPGFTSSTDLAPDPANPASWSVNGRGVHLAGNNKDINGNARVTTLAAGVPDLGAYEFVPTSVPPLAEAIPANPVSGQKQIFLFGKDTVAVVNWDALSLMPPSISVRQYTGTVPPQLQSISPNSSMYFYTDMDVISTTYNFNADIYYKDPWMGTANEASLKMVKKFGQANPWIQYNDAASNTDVNRNIISASSLTSHGYFSGINNGTLFSAHITLGGKAVFCPGGNVRLFANPSTASNFQWKRNGTDIAGAVSNIYDATVAGTYSVTVSNGTQVATIVPVGVYQVQPPSPLVSTSGSTRFCAGGNVQITVQTGADSKYQWRKNGVNIPGETNPTYTATDAGTYTAEVTNVGCSGTSAATVVSIGAPEVNLGNDIISCETNVLSLDAGNPGAKYLWSTGDTSRTIVPGNMSGQYSVKVYTGVNCADEDTINITVNPMPKVVGISYVRELNTYQLSPSGEQNANSYLWIFGDGNTSTERTLTYEYSYRPNSVKLVVFNDCGSDTVEASLSLSVNGPVANKANIKLYPNPAQSVLTIDVDGNAAMSDISVINHLGQVVYHTKADNGSKTHRVDVSNLPNGHYLLRLTTNDDAVTTRQFDVLR